MTTDIKELARQLRLAREPIRHTAADALEAMAGEVESYESARVTWAEAMRAWINRATVAEAERDRLAGEVEQACGREQRALLQRDCSTKEAEAWREERDRLKAALEFYATEAWDDDGVTSYPTEELLKDKGFIARKALGGDA